MDANGAGIPALKDDLLGLLKSGSSPRVGPLSLRKFIMLHLFGSIYGEALYQDTDVWTTYPGSRGGTNVALRPMMAQFARLFRDRYIPDLIVRHEPSIDSGEARRRGIEVTFCNQANSIYINALRRDKIIGKRIVVMDDFETKGYSAECARNMLLMAGAASVTCISVAKYGRRRQVIAPYPGHHWNPLEPSEHEETDFWPIENGGTFDENALTLIRESYQRVASEPT
jgi:hypothetical protein